MSKLLREAAMRRAYLEALERKHGPASVEVVCGAESKPLRRLNRRLPKVSRRNGKPFGESRASKFVRRIPRRIAMGLVNEELVEVIRTFSPSPDGGEGC